MNNGCRPHPTPPTLAELFKPSERRMPRTHVLGDSRAPTGGTLTPPTRGAPVAAPRALRRAAWREARRNRTREDWRALWSEQTARNEIAHARARAMAANNA